MRIKFKTKHEKNTAKCLQQQWFAWRPVKAENGYWVWLETVSRLGIIITYINNYTTSYKIRYKYTTCDKTQISI